jgi:hypothetical protein
MVRSIALSLILLPFMGISLAHANCDSPEFSNDVLNDLRILPEFTAAKTEIIQLRAPKTIIYNESYDQYRCRYTLDLKNGLSKEVSIEYKNTKTGSLVLSYEEIWSSS